MNTSTPIRLTDLQKTILARFETYTREGLTSEELHDWYFSTRSESTIRTRIAELVAEGLLRDSGKVRRSRNDRNMTVYVCA
jgi:hypothetical protein